MWLEWSDKELDENGGEYRRRWPYIQLWNGSEVAGFKFGRWMAMTRSKWVNVCRPHTFNKTEQEVIAPSPTLRETHPGSGTDDPPGRTG